MTRRCLRRHAFELVFQIPFVQFFDPEKAYGDFLREKNADTADSDFEQYVKEPLFGVLRNLRQIDALIIERLKGFSLDRLARVDLAALRLAVYEIKYDGTIPRNVAISEAVTLAKQYGTDDSASFVNGILAQISGDGE